jgi:hypothetical protein
MHRGLFARLIMRAQVALRVTRRLSLGAALFVKVRDAVRLRNRVPARRHVKIAAEVAAQPRSIPRNAIRFHEHVPQCLLDFDWAKYVADVSEREARLHRS